MEIAISRSRNVPAGTTTTEITSHASWIESLDRLLQDPQILQNNY
jgi:hypothetical protein